MAETTIELVERDHPEEPRLLCEPIRSTEPILVPSVGDVVRNADDKEWLRVKHRRFVYGPDYVHIEVFCSKETWEESDSPFNQ